MKRIALVITLAMACLKLSAQKLPTVQQGSLRAPSIVKIDGKVDEWDNLQAYNKITKIEYTVADDADNLYFVIRSRDSAATAKILIGGITFGFNLENKKNPNGPALTFPYTDSGYKLTPQGSAQANFKVLTDSEKIKAAIKQVKLIKARRLSGLTDTLISIYNTVGIQAKLTYNEGALICEIAIPLTLIKLIEPAKPFAYMVKLNGAEPVQLEGGPPPPPPGAPTTWRPSDPRHLLLEATTPVYFWGEYSLAK